MKGSGHYFDEKGVKINEQNFSDGKPDGKWITYNANGSKSGEGYYKNNLKEGKWTYWDDKGNVIYEATFKKGQVIKEYKKTKN